MSMEQSVELLAGETVSIRRKPAPVSLCPPQDSHGGKPGTNRLGCDTRSLGNEGFLTAIFMQLGVQMPHLNLIMGT
jgi:hypothetical protein